MRARPKARRTECPSCSAEVWEGLDGDYCAFRVRVDLEPIPQAAEPVAVILGLRTYWLRSGHLDRREPWHISDKTGGWRPGPIHTEHKCEPLPFELTRIALPAPRTAIAHSEKAPY